MSGKIDLSEYVNMVIGLRDGKATTNAKTVIASI